MLPSSGFDPALAVVVGDNAACEAPLAACATSADLGGPGEPDVVRYTNATGFPVTGYLVVDSASGGTEAAGGYALEAAISTAVPGDVCATATPIGPGTLGGQTTQGFDGDYLFDEGCATYDSAGRDRVYAVQVQAGRKLTATVTPSPSFDADVYLVRGPCREGTPVACLAQSSAGGPGDPDTAEYTNATGALETVFVVIDNHSAADPGGTFSLTVSIAP